MLRFVQTARLIVCAAAFLLIACNGDTAGPNGAVPLKLQGRAIALLVDVAAGTVSQVGGPDASTPDAGTPAVPAVPRFALIGEHETMATITNVTRSNGTHNRVRVRFDLALTNKFANSDLVPSTFPVPPTNAVVAFPFSTKPAGLFGLKVVATSDWDGSPWNFFNDAICIPITPPSDCYRWEGFGATISAGGTTPARTVGFDVAADITSFTVYVVVAGDIRERPLPAVIGVSEVNPVFSALVGGDSPGSRDLQVINTGGGTLTGLETSVSYHSGQPTGWLGTTLSSTTAPAVLTFQPATTALAPGVYVATVTLTSLGASNSPLSISVGLVVAQPLIVLSTTNAAFSGGFRGENPPAQEIQVTSPSGIPVPDLAVSVLYGGNASGWLTATLSSTMTPATLTLTAHVSELTTGSYFARVDVTSPLGTAEGVLVELDVAPLPDLTFTGRPDVAPGVGSVTVTNLAVTNQGFFQAGPYNVGVCLSPTPTVADCGPEAFLLRPGLAVSGVDLIPPLEVLADPGVYYLFAVVDPPHTAMVVESDETNNVLALGPIEVPAPPAGP